MSHHTTRFLYARTMVEIPERIAAERRAMRLRILCLYVPAAIALFYCAIAAWRLMGGVP